MVDIGDTTSIRPALNYLDACRNAMIAATGTSLLAGPYDLPRRRWCGACKRSIDSNAWVVGACPYCGDAAAKLAVDPLSDQAMILSSGFVTEGDKLMRFS